VNKVPCHDLFKMAAGKGNSKSTLAKRGLRDVHSTPGRSGSSPIRKQRGLIIGGQIMGNFL